MSLELFVIGVIHGRRKGVLATFAKFFFIIFSWFFGLATRFRNWFYDKGIFKQKRVDVPVISVGNIVVGGTGKTPVTVKLAQELSKDFKIAILSRGYKSIAELGPCFIVDVEKYSPAICGDEAYMMAKKLPHVMVIVGRNRYLSAKMAIKNGANLIILDDGMQHRQLYRDVEVVVMDSTNPFGYGHIFPHGLLRENLFGLSRASLIVATHANDERYKELKNKLKKYAKASLVGMNAVIDKTYGLDGQGVSLAPKTKIAAFCGIANPSYFYKTLQNQGLSLLNTLGLPDHGYMQKKALIKFVEGSKQLGAKYILCTEKDFVKIIPNIKTAIPILCLSINFNITHDKENWNLFIKKICIKIKILHILLLISCLI